MELVPVAGKSLAGGDGSLGVFLLSLFVWECFEVRGDQGSDGWGEARAAQPRWWGPSPAAQGFGGVRSWWGSGHGPILAALELIVLSGLTSVAPGAVVCLYSPNSTTGSLGMGGHPRPGCCRRDRVTPTEPPLLQPCRGNALGEGNALGGGCSGQGWGSGQPKGSWVPQPPGSGAAPVPLVGIIVVLYICERLYFKPC